MKKGFIKLSFLPDYMPIGLYLFYWLFCLCFYIFYLPIYFTLWLFSPYHSQKAKIRFFARKQSEVDRNLTNKVSEAQDDGKK